MKRKTRCTFTEVSSVLLFLLLTTFGHAQQLDKVVAVVGDEILLESDISNQYDYLVSEGEKDDGTLRCRIFEEMIIGKLLLSKSKQDSLTVSEDQVEQEVTRRITIFTMRAGGEEQLEKIYGKSILQLKIDLRPQIRDQLLTEQMRSRILSNVTITPKEVKEFFNQIPKDSLPFLPAEVEISHIMVNAPFSPEAKTEAKNQLDAIRTEILTGKMSFEDAAKLFSVDFGSAKDGGKLPEFGRGDMVPEFEEVAFTTKEGELSQVFESQYGMHILKVHKRLGDRIQASHILVVPRKLPGDRLIALKKLEQIRNKILADSISFEDAALEYSQDPKSKDMGGVIVNPTNNEYRISIDQLDADLFFKVDGMKTGEISKPSEFIRNDGSVVYHIVYLKKKYPPHVANLKDDYYRIQTAALQNKQYTMLDDWIRKARENVYIEIKDSGCKTQLSHWFPQ